MERIHIHLGKDQLKELRAIAKRNGVTVAELARRAFALYLQAKRKGGK